VSAKYSFRFDSRDRRRPLPGNIIIGQNDTETIAHVALKMLGFVLNQLWFDTSFTVLRF